MGSLIGKWEVFLDDYTYEFEITELENKERVYLKTNAFSGWQILYGGCSIDGNKLHFEGSGGRVNSRNPRFKEVMQRTHGLGTVVDLKDEDATFEYTLNGGDLQLRWIGGSLISPQVLTLSKVHTLKSEKGSSGGGGA